MTTRKPTPRELNPLPDEDRCTGRSKHKMRAWVQEHYGHPLLSEENKKLWPKAPYELVRCDLKRAPGITTCPRYHGAGNGDSKAKSERHVQTEKARAAVAAFGIVAAEDLERIDPVQELQLQAARLRNEARWLDDLVAGLDPSDHTQATPLGVGPGVWVKLRQEAHDRLNALLVKMQQLGLRELEVQISAAQRDQVLALCMWMAAQLAPERTEPELLQLVAQGVRELGSAR